MKNFLFKEEFYQEDFCFLIKNSIPKQIKTFQIDINGDFNLGNFVLEIKFQEISYKIYLIKNEINELWNFLEKTTNSNETLFLKLFNFKYETMLYIEPNKKLRFILLNTAKADKNSKRKFSYTNSEIKFDIIINKKTFLEIFYKKLYEFYKNNENIIFFEPPLINFDYWKKDSEIIRAFLKIKN